MELNTAECCRLAEALSALALGRWSEFEDRMWIAFGDDWSRLVEMLVRHRHIAFGGRWKDEPALTESGRTLLGRLKARPASATG